MDCFPRAWDVSPLCSTNSYLSFDSSSHSWSPSSYSQRCFPEDPENSLRLPWNHALSADQKTFTRLPTSSEPGLTLSAAAAVSCSCC